MGLADVLSFTGSAQVGHAVAVAAAHRGFAVQCEMGGQNAAIVLPHARPQPTAALIAGAAIAYADQKCTATRRVIVVGRQDDVMAELSAAVALDPGRPCEPGHDRGTGDQRAGPCHGQGGC